MSPKKNSKVIAFIDGACRGNPGASSVGVVFQDQKWLTLKTISSKIGMATNNIAEYFALIFALQEALMMGVTEIQIFTDSELLAKQVAGDYRVKEDTLKLLFYLVAHLRKGFKKITVSHVPREQNKLADREANRALDQELIL